MYFKNMVASCRMKSPAQIMPLSLHICGQSLPTLSMGLPDSGMLANVIRQRSDSLYVERPTAPIPDFWKSLHVFYATCTLLKL